MRRNLDRKSKVNTIRWRNAEIRSNQIAWRPQSRVARREGISRKVRWLPEVRLSAQACFGNGGLTYFILMRKLAKQ